jgi:hypothetical protein
MLSWVLFSSEYGSGTKLSSSNEQKCFLNVCNILEYTRQILVSLLFFLDFAFTYQEKIT